MNTIDRLSHKVYLEWECIKCGLVYVTTDDPFNAKCPVCGIPIESMPLHIPKDTDDA